MKYLQGVLFVFLANVALAGWVPPENPEPGAILNEARADAEAGRYEDALAKHLWFHNNALEIERSYYGVRLSYALSDWHTLAEEYPPALESMQTVRDRAKEQVRSGHEPYDSFHDFQSLNEVLGDEGQTVKLFTWLEQQQPDIARKVYRIAQPALIRAKRYQLAAKYVDAQATYGRIVGEYERNHAFEAQFGNKWGEQQRQMLRQYSRRDFTHSTTTLVALLVLSGRGEEARDISEQALLEIDTPEFHGELERALTGDVPPVWP